MNNEKTLNIIRRVVGRLRDTGVNVSKFGHLIKCGGGTVDMAEIGNAFHATADALEALAAEPEPKPALPIPIASTSGAQCCACGKEYQQSMICTLPGITVLECVCGVRWENGRLVRGPRVNSAKEAKDVTADQAMNLIGMAKDYLEVARRRLKSSLPGEAVSCVRSAVAVLESFNFDKLK